MTDRTNESIITEALVRAVLADGELEKDIAGNIHVQARYCPYCETVSMSHEEACAHDGICAKHPMALRFAQSELRLAEARELHRQDLILTNRQAEELTEKRDTLQARCAELIGALEEVRPLIEGHHCPARWDSLNRAVQGINALLLGSSDWLAAHDREVRVNALKEAAKVCPRRYFPAIRNGEKTEESFSNWLTREAERIGTGGKL
jgi:hypothetical protein